ncbi:MAG: single-stranded DNA-binding protein [Bryobacteraceae bacterium]
MQKNRIEVAGYLASRPEIRYLPSGTPIANVRLGESYSFKDGEGKPQKHTNWHSLSFYGELSSIAATYEKGDNLFVEGSVEQRQFATKSDGIKRTVHEIIVRNCHLIAQSRNQSGKAGTQGAEVPQNDETRYNSAETLEDHGDSWPVH